MSTPTVTCGELSCDECNARTAALMAERDAALTELTTITTESDQLRAEVARLRAGIADCLSENGHLADG